MFGATILVVFSPAALFAPRVAPHDPYDLTRVNMGGCAEAAGVARRTAHRPFSSERTTVDATS